MIRSSEKAAPTLRWAARPVGMPVDPQVLREAVRPFQKKKPPSASAPESPVRAEPRESRARRGPYPKNDRDRGPVGELSRLGETADFLDHATLET